MEAEEEESGAAVTEPARRQTRVVEMEMCMVKKKARGDVAKRVRAKVEGTLLTFADEGQWWQQESVRAEVGGRGGWRREYGSR